MAKTKKKVPFAASAAAAKKDNPFEAIHSKKKWSILGRNTNGAQKNVNTARSDAIQKRTDTLLVEYKQLKKANAFIDRRFGEYDNDLTEDEKAIQRFQAQRLKQVRKNKFTLTEEEQEPEAGSLTHLGNPLSQLDDFKDRIGQDDEDDDGALDAQLTQFNFGGGTEGNGQHKSKKEVMQEIIAKSKTAKAAKQMQKEEDVDLLEDLDSRFAGISKASLAGLMKPIGSNKDDRQKADTAVDQKYDVIRREMVFEGRGAAGERILSSEEQLEKEQEALAKLEKARLKRMLPNGDDADDDKDEVPMGGFAKRRMLAKKDAKDKETAKKTKMDTGDAEAEDDFAVTDDDQSESDDDNAEAMQESALDARRAARAAGEHPLQAEFRARSAQILLKYGMQPTEQSLADLEDDDDDDEDSEEDDDNDEENDDDDGGGDSVDMDESDSAEEVLDDEDDDDGDDDSDGEQDIAALLQKAIAMKQAALAGDAVAGTEVLTNDSDNGDASDDADEADEPIHPAKKAKMLARAAIAELRANLPDTVTDAPDTVTEDDISYTIAAPKNYAAFAQLVQGRSAQQVLVIVQRVRAYNAAALASDNKVGLQMLFGIILQHFATLAGALPLRRDLLDGLVPLLVTMAAEVPLYAATVARARLAGMHKRMASSLADPQAGVGSMPNIRSLLLLRLFVTIFPVTDHKHSVLTPLALFAGHALSLCPPVTHRDVALGLYLAALLSGMAGKRYTPEVTAFCEALIQSALPEDHRTSREVCAGHMRVDVGWLHSTKGHSLMTEANTGLDVWDVCLRNPEANYFQKASFKGEALLTCMHLVRAQMNSLDGSCALPAAMAPLLGALCALHQHGGLHTHMHGLVGQLISDIEDQSTKSIATRVPVVNPAMKGTVAKKLFNPRYEIEFDKDRDYDPDRERADERKMRRTYVKELRSLKREVTRDAAFIGEVRRSEKESAGNRRDKTQKKAIAFLQQQEADFKSGGQGGMNPHLKKKKK